MLAEAVAAGLVTKTAAPDDGRRAELGITAAGQELLAAARGWQDAAFARIVAGWPRPTPGGWPATSSGWLPSPPRHPTRSGGRP